MARTKKPLVLPNGLKIGALCQYYDEGYRVGTLELVKGVTASIRPMAAYKGVQKHLVTVPLDEVKGIV